MPGGGGEGLPRRAPLALGSGAGADDGAVAGPVRPRPESRHRGRGEDVRGMADGIATLGAETAAAGRDAAGTFGGRAGAGLRSPRVRAIYSSLLDAILANRLPPATRLPEDDLGAIYGASRTIVRSALEALAHDGVLTIEPNRGAFVASPSVADARDVFDARLLVEVQLAERAARCVTPADITALRQHLAEEHAALDAGLQQRAILLSGLFHVHIAEATGQRALAGFVRELVSRSSLIVALYWRRRDAICGSHAHEELVEALASGQPDLAGARMRAHLLDILDGLDLTERPAKSIDLGDVLRDA